MTGMDAASDALDHGGVAHAGHAAVRADVGGNALQSHDGHRARVLGDLRLLGVHASMMAPPFIISANPVFTFSVP